MKTKTTTPKRVERVQIGARMEKSLVKVLRGLADYLDLSLGDLLEGITLHALEGKDALLNGGNCGRNAGGRHGSHHLLLYI